MTGSSAMRALDQAADEANRAEDGSVPVEGGNPPVDPIRKVTGPERILEIINITDSVKYVSDRSNSTDRTNSG